MRRQTSWILAMVTGLAMTSAGYAAGPSTGYTRMADGFDFPVGKPDAQGYYKARGFRVGGHPGEDWNGMGGGDSDLGDPVNSIGHGLVVFARDVRKGWGNVVIIRHAYREGNETKTVDSLYAHLQRITVREGQAVTRGQLVGTIGTNRGMYDAHLHFEIRKNITIGMARSQFARDFNNYYDPTKFIGTRRALKSRPGNYPLALNTFVQNEGYATPSVDSGSTRGYSSSPGVNRRSGSMSDFSKKQFRFKIDRFSDLRGE